MGTKLKPGKFDCYALALPDEPFFVLLGRDIEAPRAVEHWCDLRARRLLHGVGEEPNDPEKLQDANNLAQEMRDWRVLNLNKWKERPTVVQTVAKSFSSHDFATAILSDILVNVFENDATVADALEKYKPSLISAIQKWGDIKGLESKSALLQSVTSILTRKEIPFTPETMPAAIKPGAVYIPPKEPPKMKPVIEGPQFVWVRGPKGPVAEVWHDEKQRESEAPVQSLQRHPMTEEDRTKTIEELKVIYPYRGNVIAGQQGMVEPK